MFAKTLKSNIELISLKQSRVKETCEEQREKERIKQTSSALAQVMGTRNWSHDFTVSISLPLPTTFCKNQKTARLIYLTSIASFSGDEIFPSLKSIAIFSFFFVIFFAKRTRENRSVKDEDRDRRVNIWAVLKGHKHTVSSGNRLGFT